MRGHTTMVALALVASFAAELGFRQWQQRPLPLTGPQPDLPFVPPSESVTVLNGGRLPLDAVLFRPNQCTMLVIASTNCSICQHMRYTWPSRVGPWKDSVGVPVRTVWLSSAEDTASLRAFFRGIETADMTIAQMPFDYPARELGAYGTPTVYLLDRHRQLRIGILADQLPPATAARRLCHES